MNTNYNHSRQTDNRIKTQRESRIDRVLELTKYIEDLMIIDRDVPKEITHEVQTLCRMLRNSRPV